MVLYYLQKLINRQKNMVWEILHPHGQTTDALYLTFRTLSHSIDYSNDI